MKEIENIEEFLRQMGINPKHTDLKIERTSLGGSITKEYTVWCGFCNEWFQVPNCNSKSDAIREFRAMGWSLSKKHGWLCSECRSKRG